MDNSSIYKEVLYSPAIWSATVALCVALLVLDYYKNYYRYWSRRGMKGVEPLPLITTMKSIFIKDRTKEAVALREKYGKFYGGFMSGKPFYIVADLDLIRQMSIKDFDSFANHSHNEWMNKHQQNFLVWLRDDHWRRVRSMLTPTFTSGKIKRMYKLMDGCVDALVDSFRDKLTNGQTSVELDLIPIYSILTLDVISTCCYGIKLRRGPDGRPTEESINFLNDAKRVINFNTLRISMIVLLPHSILRLFGFTVSAESEQEAMMKHIQGLLLRRRKNPNKYDDLLQMMVDSSLNDTLELNEMDKLENHHAVLSEESIREDQKKLISKVRNTNNRLKLNDSEILEQAAFLLSAGYETTKASLSTITYMLAHNQDAQERLYKLIKDIAEFDAATKSYKFNYDHLTSCKYLDAVISESLRMLGPAVATDRQAVCDYYVEKYNVTIPKGEKVIFDIGAIHHDPELWESPEKFNPDRFMPGKSEHIIPGSYMPFGIGPRHCIGMRFSLTETKLTLAKVMMKYRFKPADGTHFPPEPALSIAIDSIKDCRVVIEVRE